MFSPDSFIHTHTHTRATLAVLFEFYHTCVYTLSQSSSRLAISSPSLGTHLHSSTVRISPPHATVLENGFKCSRSCFWQETPWLQQLMTKAHVSEWWQAVTSPSFISIPPLLTCSSTQQCFCLLAVNTRKFVGKHIFLHTGVWWSLSESSSNCQILPSHVDILLSLVHFVAVDTSDSVSNPAFQFLDFVETRAESLSCWIHGNFCRS